MKDREITITKVIEELFIKLIIANINMDRFEEEEMKKIRPIKNTWYDWLISCIPKPIRKSVSVFKTNTPEKTVYGRGHKLSKPRKPFISKENKEKIKDRINN